MRLVFNRVALSAESVRAAREWFSSNARRCAKEAREGRLRVNDTASYVSAREAYAAEVLVSTGHFADSVTLITSTSEDGGALGGETRDR